MQYVQSGERVRRMSDGGGEVDEMMTTAQMRWKIVIMNFFLRERKKLKKKKRDRHLT